jgi:hypothetical protein
MTVDIREVSEIVAPSSLGKNPQDYPDSFNPVVILNEVKDPSEKTPTLRSHVIQIHYSDIPPRFSGGAGGVKSQAMVCSPTIPTTS